MGGVGKRLFGDDLFRKVFANTAKLGSSKILGGLFSLIALVCTTHGLSAGAFGVLTLISSYALSVTAFGSFQSWQVVLHYGAVPWKDGQRGRVVNTIRFAFGLDLTAGLVSMAVAMAALLLFGHKLGVRAEHRHLALLYCTLIPGMASSTSLGVLRLLDRVGMLARQKMVGPVLQAVLCAIAMVLKGNLASFVIAWYVARLVSQIWMWVCTWRALKEVGLSAALRPSLLGAGRRMPAGTWSFTWMSSINVLIYSAWQPVSNLMVGSVLGNAAAGVYGLALKLLSAVRSPARMLEKNYYPEIVRLDPRTQRPWAILARFCGISALVGVGGMLLVYVGGQPLISLLGHRYGQSATVLKWMAPSVLFFLFPLPLDSILFTSGRAASLMVIEGSSALIYLLLVILLGHFWGLNGVGLAYTVGRGILALMVVSLSLYVFWHRDRIIPPHERRKQKRAPERGEVKRAVSTP
ncbi:lipopolysaccharide biosynthesis protein [Oecophyllibacter saccharovorans]|uniref:Lipopolysaccharide biosynthesis protein n=1 Tax=Oecophyllibacter saccharovorans TaxID=2558360 RepID=A0A506UKW3_9PROT|nr:lipopolysaccharide biosynthesis protein [Oecophyllibacter saccharovorans]QDH15154.1 lipopolysaccharide biosynthesis protein [Oecophyllibacter saccharovorans]TPW33715.1 lipopolysaccharide biosynthesis protein [Oecophyllibacter saccharovorans]TPW33991.1 lipopolysaccharide biosynthesis protein [Oecophyllibacter saccharovorans]